MKLFCFKKVIIDSLASISPNYLIELLNNGKNIHNLVFRLKGKNFNSTLLAHQRFNATFLQIIDQTLEDVLGSDCKREFFLYLKSVLLIDREDVPLELVNFCACLNKIFGSSATLIEKAIVKKTLSQFRNYNINIEEFKDSSLSDVAEHCKTLIQLKMIE